jgi:endoglucanase
MPKTRRRTPAAAKDAAHPASATARERAQHERWLLELTGLPTAAGREDRVIDWIDRWVRDRPDLALRRDDHGNLVITQKSRAAGRKGSGRRERTPDPIWFQAHLDHPAFVVRSIGDRKTVELAFRGGVHDPYFDRARIDIIDAAGKVHRATIVSLDAAAKPFKIVTARLARSAPSIAVGDIGRWALPAPKIAKGLIHTHGCDDLAAVAAALAALDRVRGRPGHGHVGAFFTRAEEIGFVGTIGAARDGTLPKSSRIICLENSRSFAESPIGGGPILRVGDRRSVFVPELTNRIGDIMMAHQKGDPSFVYQRKLMPGGTCEATAYASYGYRSTCLCLALGNYHNMVDIDGVLAGKRPARIGSEFVSVADFHGLVTMLEIIARDLDSASVPPLRDTMETLWKDLSFVLD